MRNHNERDDAWAGVIGFIITWCITGILGVMPWGQWFHSNTEPAPEWHMNQPNAWLIWALVVTMTATAAGFIVYAWKRWG